MTLRPLRIFAGGARTFCATAKLAFGLREPARLARSEQPHQLDQQRLDPIKLRVITRRGRRLIVEELGDRDPERARDPVEVPRVRHRLAGLPPLPLPMSDADLAGGVLLTEAGAFAQLGESFDDSFTS
jgi:hypothetical protein